MDLNTSPLSLGITWLRKGLSTKILVLILPNKMGELKEKIVTFLKLPVPFFLLLIFPIVSGEMLSLQQPTSLIECPHEFYSSRTPFTSFLIPTPITDSSLAYLSKFLVVQPLSMFLPILGANLIPKLSNVCFLGILQQKEV